MSIWNYLVYTSFHCAKSYMSANFPVHHSQNWVHRNLKTKSDKEKLHFNDSNKPFLDKLSKYEVSLPPFTQFPYLSHFWLGMVSLIGRHNITTVNLNCKILVVTFPLELHEACLLVFPYLSNSFSRKRRFLTLYWYWISPFWSNTSFLVNVWLYSFPQNISV